ncbi:MAG: GIY-YIG nuclease family protein [Pseudomonadales bacterium]|nr:GIY-YIG nuclease family protein [Pseudomonadales bacterium]
MSDQRSVSTWWLYIIQSRDGKFYTGISTDVERRFNEHTGSANGAKSKGAKALRGKSPLKLVYQSLVGNRSKAQKIEYKVKRLTKAEKESLVKSQQAIIDFLKL